MSWKGILTKSSANKVEPQQEIEFKQSGGDFSLEIRSEIDGLEYDNIKATVYEKAEAYGDGIYEFQPVRMEIDSITLYIPDEDDSDEEKKINNQTFDFGDEGNVIDIGFEYSSNTKSGQIGLLIIEPLLTSGDLILEYRDGNIFLEQLVLDYSF